MSRYVIISNGLVVNVATGDAGAGGLVVVWELY